MQEQNTSSSWATLEYQSSMESILNQLFSFLQWCWQLGIIPKLEAWGKTNVSASKLNSNFIDCHLHESSVSKLILLLIRLSRRNGFGNFGIYSISNTMVQVSFSNCKMFLKSGNVSPTPFHATNSHGRLLLYFVWRLPKPMQSLYLELVIIRRLTELLRTYYLTGRYPDGSWHCIESDSNSHS